MLPFMRQTAKHILLSHIRALYITSSWNTQEVWDLLFNKKSKRLQLWVPVWHPDGDAIKVTVAGPLTLNRSGISNSSTENLNQLSTPALISFISSVWEFTHGYSHPREALFFCLINQDMCCWSTLGGFFCTCFSQHVHIQDCLWRPLLLQKVK